MKAEFIFQPVHNITMSVCFRETVMAGEKVPTKRIMLLCAEVFGVLPEELSSKLRARNVAYARFCAWDLLRRHTKLSYTQIGRRFGNRHHTTVMSGVLKSGGLLADPDETWYTEVFERVQARLLV